MSTTTNRHRPHRQGAPSRVQGARGLAAQAREDRPLGPLRDLPVPAADAQHPRSSPPRAPTSAACSSRSPRTSSWRWASTSSSATPACSTSATSGFYAIGAYTVGVLSSEHAHLPWSSCVPDRDRSSAMISGVILGAPTLRVRGDYLAIVTLGFGEIVRLCLVNSQWLGGAAGHLGHPETPERRGLPGAEPRLERRRPGRRPRHDVDVPQVRDQRLRPVLLARARRHRPRPALRHPRQEQPGRAGLGGDARGRGRRRADGRAHLPLQAAGVRARVRPSADSPARSSRRSRASSTRRASSCSCRSSSSPPSSSVAPATGGASSSARSSSATSRSASVTSRTSACSSSASP